VKNQAIARAFAELSTPLVADACVRVKLHLRLAPPGISSLPARARVAGRVLPARHFGSVDVFLEALESAEAGDILAIDNGGRVDEGCIGDLTVLEARAAGVAGVVVWGAHRDTPELEEIGLPVLSYARCLAGPVRLDARTPDALLNARFGNEAVSREDVAFGDVDGVLFVAAASVEEVLGVAREIWLKEREQASAIRAGRALREQLQFRQYLAAREKNPSLTFRQHLRKLGGAIEE
jgi:regulator of RNase E activity RraA